MDHETLFTASKWDILEQISETPKSPIEIAKRISTSVANISQQLRLLEMAGLVKSKRVPNRDRGQPRILYSLNKSSAFVICTAPGFVKKKDFNLNLLRKATMKAWFYPVESQQSAIEKFLWEIETHLKNISSIYIDRSSKNLSFVIFSDKKFSMTKIETSSGSTPVKLTFYSSDKSLDLKNHYQIYGEDNKNARGEVEQ